MTRTRRRRYHVGPLARQAELHWDTPRIDGSDASTDVFTVGVFARLVGVSPKTVQRWTREGGIPEPSAERAAHELGLSIHSVWPDEYGYDPSRVTECLWCGRVIVADGQRGPDPSYCSGACRVAAHRSHNETAS